MSKKITLYHHQKRFLHDQIPPDKHLLCWDTGTGKTLASVKWAEIKDADAMYVCPKAGKKKWVREIEMWAETSGMIKGSMVVSKEEFRRDWNILPQYDTLVIDEAHYFAGMRNAKMISKMARSLVWYIKKHKVKHILLLSATPYLSTPFNIYYLAKILGHDWNYQDFKNDFFEYDLIGIRAVLKPKPDIEDEIADLVEEIGDVVHIEECADIPEQVFEREDFELNPAQKKTMKSIYDVNPIVRFTKYHQIENGTLKSDGYTEDVTLRYDKADRIKEYCEQTKKVAVICRYNLQIDFLKEHLEKLGKNIYVINGATKDKDKVTLAAEADDECIVLINAAASELYELPSIGLIIFASMSFSYKDYKQMLGRFLRLNKLKKNVYIHMIGGDVDLAVYQSIKKKQDFDIAIYAKSKS